MRKLFSEYGLTILTAVVSMYVFSIFSSSFYKPGNQFVEILKEWIEHLV